MFMIILSAPIECKSAVNKIGFSAHSQTSLCYREIGFDSREIQENARPDLHSLGTLSIVK